ncbi:MAG TPA: hypothetical protein VH206_06420 [Xanthobacteraceae bacterium]|jgi:uncharacterized membrane protein YhaH (DUF805 family)|nr:hypothetical protein [Xanthobacteraceae bacterium]
MEVLRSLFSPKGEIKPSFFIAAVIVVYVLGAGSHVLTVPGVITKFHLWPFMAVQAVLIWVWFVLHANRLHDAERSGGIAAGAAILYAISIVLLLILVLGFHDHPMSDPSAGGALNLLLLLTVIASLSGTLQFDTAWAMIALLTGLAFVPVILAVSVTVWAATRPTVQKLYGERRI